MVPTVGRISRLLRSIDKSRDMHELVLNDHRHYPRKRRGKASVRGKLIEGKYQPVTPVVLTVKCPKINDKAWEESNRYIRPVDSH